MLEAGACARLARPFSPPPLPPLPAGARGIGRGAGRLAILPSPLGERARVRGPGAGAPRKISKILPLSASPLSATPSLMDAHDAWPDCGSRALVRASLVGIHDHEGVDLRAHGPSSATLCPGWGRFEPLVDTHLPGA